MQTYRAYLAGPNGTIIWAAWIEAPDLPTAERQAAALCNQGTPAVELWTLAHRGTGSEELEAV